MICPVLPWPHPKLSEQSGIVTHFDVHIEKLCMDLCDTAHAAGAASMSAIQIGAAAKIIYITKLVAGQPLMLVNPVYEERGALLQHHKESCASLPGVTIDMQRSATIQIAAQNSRGDRFAFKCDGPLAQAIQHEMAHLEGKTIVDQARPGKRWFYRDLMRKYGGARGYMLDYRGQSAIV